MMNFLRLLSAGMPVAAAFFFLQFADAQAVNSNVAAYYRGDTGHSGYISTTTAPILSVAWQNTLPGVRSASSTPALVDDVLYLGAGSHVYALNAKDGTIKWQYPADGASVPGSFNSSPAVADGKVFIGSDNDNLSVLDASTGALLWQVATAGAVSAAPIVADGAVFFGSTDAHLYAINENNQTPLWGGQFKSDGPIFTAPALADGLLYFGDFDGNLYAVRETSGDKLWTYSPAGGVSPGSPVYRNGILYSVSGSNIIAVSARTADLRTTFNFPANILSPPTISDTSVYASASNQEIVSFNLRGTVNWRSKLDDIVTTPLQVTDSFLYATSRAGVIYALDLSSGKVVWSYALQKAIVQPTDTSDITVKTLPKALTNAAVLVQDGRLFVLTKDGTLTAFTANAPDNVVPNVLAVYPKSNATVGGANIPFRVFVTDIGSGINPNTASLKVDGWSVPVFYGPSDSLVSVKLDAQKTGIDQARIVLPTLPDGQHTATFKITDWRGNILTESWSFTVDNTNNPTGSAPPTPITPDSNIQASTAATDYSNGKFSAPANPPIASAEIPGPGGNDAGPGRQQYSGPAAQARANGGGRAPFPLLPPI
jgi:outer membrane protein assembly factor BamB